MYIVPIFYRLKHSAYKLCTIRSYISFGSKTCLHNSHYPGAPSISTYLDPIDNCTVGADIVHEVGWLRHSRLDAPQQTVCLQDEPLPHRRDGCMGGAVVTALQEDEASFDLRLWECVCVFGGGRVS